MRLNPANSSASGRDAGGFETNRLPRRALMRRALASAGALTAGSAAVAARANAAGTSPAYTDASNTFTANQIVNARLGIGVAPDSPVHVKSTGQGPAVRVDPHTMGLAIVHDTDWQGQTHDLVNLFHKSTGDGVFIAHLGGVPAGYTGTVGGDAGLNVLVPYFLDDSGSGRDAGTLVNNLAGTKGIHIETQAVTKGSRAIDVQHFSNDAAMYMIVQPPSYGQPVGTGGPLHIDDYSTVASIELSKWTAPSNFAVLDISGHSSAQHALWIRDETANARFRVRSDGLTRIVDTAGNIKLEAGSSGQLALGSGFGDATLQYQGAMQTNGIARNVALVNSDGSAGSGTSIEFGDGSAQYAGINASYDNRLAGLRAAGLSFRVRSKDALTERLRVDGSGIGFFAASTANRPTVTGSRGGDAVVTRLITALAGLGLIKDQTTP